LTGAAQRRRLIAFAHGIDDPACRFRIRQYVPCLEQAGWDVRLSTNHPERPRDSPYRNPLLRTAHQRCRVAVRQLWRRWDIRAAAAFDAVLLNRDLLQGRIEYEQLLLRENPRVIFDFDDAIFLGEKAGHTEWICRRAAWVTAGNERLASFARQFTDRVTVLPTVVDTDACAVSRQDSRGRPVRIGWLGSDRSIQETLFPFLPLFARLQQQLGFDFVIVSKPEPAVPEPALRWSFVEWSPAVETRIGDVIDIGIMPLTDTEFHRGKCGCKLLQYMAAGLPVVASPVGINSYLVATGERGHLAETEADWSKAFAELIADRELRLRMGARGRAFVEREFSRSAWFPVLLDILEKVANGPSRRRR